MQLSDFDFELPDDRIALRPAEPRDSARLLEVRPGGALLDHRVRDLPSLLRAGACRQIRIPARRKRHNQADGLIGEGALRAERPGQDGGCGKRCQHSAARWGKGHVFRPSPDYGRKLAAPGHGSQAPAMPAARQGANVLGPNGKHRPYSRRASRATTASASDEIVSCPKICVTSRI